MYSESVSLTTILSPEFISFSDSLIPYATEPTLMFDFMLPVATFTDTPRNVGIKTAQSAAINRIKIMFINILKNFVIPTPFENGKLFSEEKSVYANN